MNFYISNVCTWSTDGTEGVLCEDGKVNWPKLTFVPAMQRRRLSAFAKMALHVANQTVETLDSNLPIVFSSRHGDLHNTSKLIGSIADEQALSPTAFALSVHNAIPGLYSILTSNKQAINAVSAGKDTFAMAITDAYARLKSGRDERILLIHVDQALPQAYDGFRDELQVSHAMAMVISLTPLSQQCSAISMTFEPYEQQSGEMLPMALAFSTWVNSEAQNTLIPGGNKAYLFAKND